MKGGKRPLGYTIIEVMIVLAVSGVMFLIAASFISGKQERTSFTSGVNEMSSNVQDVIQQVSSGQYSDIPLSCSFNGTSTTINPGTVTQGMDQSCVFLGKMINFLPPAHPSLTNPTNTYNLLSFAGGRTLSGSNGDTVITSLNQADPAVINALTSTYTIPDTLNALSVNVVDANSGTTVASWEIGFFQSQGSNNASGSLGSGAQTVGLYYTNLSNPSNIQQAQSADICLTDGTYYAEVMLGDNSSNSASPLAVTVKMDDTTPC
jgi:prepilin-type N-terminal cleavage/methylation domain-containing protein